MQSFRITPIITILISLLLTAQALSASVKSADEVDRHVSVNQTSSGISLDVIIVNDLIEHPSKTIAEGYPQFSIEGELMTSSPGMPVVPVISRTFIVPPHVGIELSASETAETDGGNDLFPPKSVTMSDPFIIRGVRLVNVNIYPVQIDLADNSSISHENITAAILFTDSEPVNPANLPPHTNYSPVFVKFLNAISSNSEALQRDYVGENSGYVKHYAIVTHEGALEHAIPLIEWKRQSGNRVDILNYGDQDAADPEAIRNDLRFLYESYLENGEEPFDHILIVGDRDQDENNQEVEWIVGSFEGTPSMEGLANHADYLYGDMENDDSIPDVAVGRFASGNLDMMELAVGRTLAYESAPPLDERNTLDRVGIYTQHWSETWNVSLNYTTTRWGFEAARQVGFGDILIEEADPNVGDDNGNHIGPILAEWLNDGLSLMIGRAENRYWQHALRDVDENDIHPIVFNTCAHGEFALHNLFRTGRGDSLLGATAATSCWGDLSTVPNNTLWMSMVNGVLLKDLTIGWGRNYATSTLGAVFPGNEQVIYELYSTDYDLLGDPGLKPWIGVPQVVTATLPESISTAPNQYVDIVVRTDDDQNQPVENATVTLYMSGELPDPEGYAEWEPIYMTSGITDQNGRVSILIADELPEGVLTVTITGRDVYPLQQEINVTAESRFVGISGVDHSEGDGTYHPGEEINISITATNYSADDLTAVTASLSADTPHLTIGDDNPIEFGDIAAGGSVTRDIPAIRISQYCPNASEPSITTVFNSQGDLQVGSSSIVFDIAAPKFEINSPIAIITEETEFDIELNNIGSQASGVLTATLISEDWSITVLNGESSYPNIPAGRAATNNNGRFRIDKQSLAIPGSTADMLLVLTGESGFVDTARFSLQVDELQPNVPTGPDKYGYVCIDVTDSLWSPQTNFQYQGIGSYDRTFRGTDMDFGGEQTDATFLLDLPFTFRFYGEAYDQITVCINGFITPGEQVSAVNYQSYPMELGVGGGMGIIAPFWHHLILGDGNEKIKYYYYEQGHYMIIEWHNARYFANRDQDLRFQVIIYDPEHYPTPTGDSVIEFHYRDVFWWAGNPQEGETPYPTIGLSSPHGNTGLTHTFRNRRPFAADSISSQRVLKFTTIPYGNPELTMDRRLLHEVEMLRPDMVFERPIKLKNEGTAPLAFNVATDRRVNWLSLSPVSGRMLSGDTLDLILTINTAGLDDSDTVNVTVSDGWEKSYTIPVIINVDEGNEINPDDFVPLEYALEANFPNPFNSTTEIRYSLKNDSHVRLQIYELNGRLVQSLVDEQHVAGHYNISFDAEGLSSGVYLYSIKTESFSSVRKMILLR